MHPFEALKKHRLIPVVELREAELASDLAQALCAGGLPAIEITFRTEEAAEALRQVAKSHGDILIAAGTVVSVDQAKAAIDAGAKLVVSPGLNRPVIEHCLKVGVACLPGVVTPTDIETARGFGLDTLKFFPAEAYGGVNTLKALSAVYGKFRFVPTGGINPSNLASYLKLPTVIACGGSWLTPAELIRQRRFDEITRLTAEAVALVQASC